MEETPRDRIIRIIMAGPTVEEANDAVDEYQTALLDMIDESLSFAAEFGSALGLSSEVTGAYQDIAGIVRTLKETR